MKLLHCYIAKLLPRKKQFNNLTIQQFNNRQASLGFTLIEAVVVLAILGVLIGVTIRGLNPAAQLEKARDATRLHDISQMKIALDTYYNDKKCYPTTLSFGGDFKSTTGTTIYMQKVPQDPSFTASNQRSYTYVTKEGDNCPQWNVLYATLEKPDTQKEICPLAKLTSKCVPADFTSAWACQVSGDVDCAYLATTNLGPTSVPVTQTPTSAVTPTPTAAAPTPTPDPNTATYNITSFLTPTFTRADFGPENPGVGATQTMTAYLNDADNPITLVSVKVTRDNVAKTYPMTFLSGTASNGVWTVSFPVTTSYTNNYSASFTATDSAQQSSNVVVSFK